MELREMTIEELETRKSELVSSLDNEGADLDAIETEVRSIVEEMETRKANEQKKNEVRSMVAQGEGTVVREKVEEVREMPTIAEIRNSKEYVEAYANYIKTGKAEECRALLSENGTNGTVAVPAIVYDIVKTAWDKEGIMRRVKKTYLKGNLKVGFEISATGAVVHAEGANAPAEETLVLGIVELVPESIKKWITISDEALDLSGEAFLQYIYDELAYQIAKKAADELVAKIDATTSTGSATSPAQSVMTANAIGLDTVAQAMALLSDEANDPVVIMNKATWGAFKAAQYAANFPVDVFEGLDVEFNNSIKSFATASTGDTYMIVGDLGHGAQANFPNGDEITFKFDDLSLAEKDLVKVVGREYVALDVIAPKSFVKVQK